MGARSLNKEDPQTIRMVFQRLCEDEAKVQLAFGAFRGEFSVLAETPDRIILGLTDLERGQWGLKPGSRLTLQVMDRGLPYEAIVDFHGHGRLHGVEASHVSQPRMLRALDAHRLADYTPDRPIPCPFADQQNNVKDGLITAFGEDGVELAPPEGTRELGDILRLNAQSSVELRAAFGAPLALPVRVAYFGDRVWGLRFAEHADPPALGRYRQWLREALHHQAQRDLARFSFGGTEARRIPGKPLASGATLAPRLLADRDPLVLVLAEGEAFPARLAEALGRKLGIAALDLGKGPLRPHLADLGAGDGHWGRVRLILLHHQVRGGGALEWCRRLVQEEQCPLPILVAGSEEEAMLKRNRAMAAGAVDHLVVEPFHVLGVLRTLEETLRLFA
jgi:CheY-like chemotaxis protein